jgi:hypothetical protein
MSSARPGPQIAWPDDMLDIVKALPRCYQTSAELPQHILMLLDRMEQNPLVQQQQQQQQQLQLPKKE